MFVVEFVLLVVVVFGVEFVLLFSVLFVVLFVVFVVELGVLFVVAKVLGPSHNRHLHHRDRHQAKELA